MELWMKYALVAAFFIAVRDIFASRIARKYNYIDYKYMPISLYL